MIPIPVHHLATDVMWPKVQAYLEPAIAHNSCSGWFPDTLKQAIGAGQVILFVDDMVNPRNALTAQFQTWSRQDPITKRWFGDRVFYINFMGGEGGEIDWKEGLKHMREYGHKMGAVRVCFNARDGWFRKFDLKRLVTLCEIKE